MIFFMYESKLCMATLVFYTCIYFPLIQMKNAILNILGFILCINHHSLIECSDHSTVVDSKDTCSVDLPMRRYGDLMNSVGSDEEACSVCLVEFESEDMVSQLSKCGHIFHMVCIEKWMDRNQFTCPLCRTSFLNVHGRHEACNSMVSCISR